jgi:hypothetical protein
MDAIKCEYALFRSFNDERVAVRIINDKIQFMGRTWIPPETHSGGKFIRMCSYAGTSVADKIGKDCFMIMFHDYRCDDDCNESHYYNTWRAAEIFEYFQLAE